ncbi:MAG: D-alanine--D-alanine ligase [Firmicutes bacterium]|nr:D-alanine--D-alanine ligase [Bacillota bacterium]
MGNKLTIGVVFGGQSDEYDVSLHSAANVIKAFDEDKYELVKIGITKRGQWYVTKAKSDEIADDKWTYCSNTRCIVPHDPTIGGIYMFNDNERITIKKIDCFFPVLHGDHGEDGEIQGLFSLAQIPFVGSGVKASANCMDKSSTKALASLVGVDMAEHYLVRRKAWDRDAKNVIERIEAQFEDRLPLFVKPCSAGSSVGVTKVKSYAELGPAIRCALEHDDKVLVEECIVGREFEVAVMGNSLPYASRIGEILSAGEFYDYESKYTNPESMTRVVEDIPEEKMDEIREKAIRLYRGLDCRGLARVDFFYTAEGKVYFNEINTLPGFTDISMYPSLWNSEGVTTTELVDRLVTYAMREHENWSLIERSPSVI